MAEVFYLGQSDIVAVGLLAHHFAVRAGVHLFAHEDSRFRLAVAIADCGGRPQGRIVAEILRGGNDRERVSIGIGGGSEIVHLLGSPLAYRFAVGILVVVLEADR